MVEDMAPPASHPVSTGTVGMLADRLNESTSIACSKMARSKMKASLPAGRLAGVTPTRRRDRSATRLVASVDGMKSVALTFDEVVLVLVLLLWREALRSMMWIVTSLTYCEPGAAGGGNGGGGGDGAGCVGGGEGGGGDGGGEGGGGDGGGDGGIEGGGGDGGGVVGGGGDGGGVGGGGDGSGGVAGEGGGGDGGGGDGGGDGGGEGGGGVGGGDGGGEGGGEGGIGGEGGAVALTYTCTSWMPQLAYRRPGCTRSVSSLTVSDEAVSCIAPLARTRASSKFA